MSQLIDQITTICCAQPYYGILITGLYLSSLQIESVGAMLTPETLNTNSAGRLFDIPVFPLAMAENVDFNQIQ